MICNLCENQIKKKCPLGTRLVNGTILEEIADEYMCASDSSYSPELSIEVNDCKYFIDMNREF